MKRRVFTLGEANALLPHLRDVLEKIQEEAGELAEAVHTGDHDRIEDEMGDMLFVLANLARHLGVDPELALRRTNAKFVRRFNALEDDLHAQGASPAAATLEEMDALSALLEGEEVEV